MPTPRPGIETIDPYKPGRAEAAGANRVVKLSSNETPLGPSPKAMTAYQEAASSLHLYPEGTSAALRDAIAYRYGLNADRIICGAGSDEILHLIAQAYLNEGDEVIYSEHGFLVYPIVTKAACAIAKIAKEENLTTSVDNMLALASDKTKIVFVANPNNPTGTYLPGEELRRLRAGLPSHTLLVIDAAYAEYVKRNDYETGIELVSMSDNVIMTRTFSKIGLAALRLGWAYCPTEVCGILNRIRPPFNISVPAQLAGVAALVDRAHTEAMVAHNEKWRAWLTEQLGALGLPVTPSVGNFVLFEFPATPGKTAVEAEAYLAKRGLLLRAVTNYGLPNHLRMTVGLEQDNKDVVDALEEFLKA